LGMVVTLAIIERDVIATSKTQINGEKALITARRGLDFDLLTFGIQPADRPSDFVRIL